MLIATQLFRIFFMEAFLHKVLKIFRKEVGNNSRKGHRCMPRNIFSGHDFGLEAAVRHLRIFFETKSDNRKTILNSLTPISFVFKSNMFRSRYRS